MIFTTDPKNGRYQLALAKLRRVLGKGPDYVFSADELKDMHFGTLQLEAPVSTTGTTILQTAKGNMNTDNPDSILLDKNDIFIATGRFLGIRRFSGGKYSTEPLFSYPDNQYFDGTKSGSTAEYKALLSYYQGTHTIKTGNITLQDTISNLTMYKVPNAPYGSTEVQAEFDFDKLVYGYPEPLALFGANNYEVRLQAGSAADWTIADGSYDSAGSARTSRNEFVWIFEGLKVIGGSNPTLQIDRF